MEEQEMILYMAEQKMILSMVGMVTIRYTERQTTILSMAEMVMILSMVQHTTQTAHKTKIS